MNRYRGIDRDRWAPLVGVWLVGLLLLLSPCESGAHVELNPFNLSHNRPSHLVSTVGLQACIQAVSTIRGIDSNLADSIGLTARGCRDAANSMSQTAREAEQVVQDTAQDVIDCASDPVGCIAKLAEQSGVTDPNMTKVATLAGNISIDTGAVSMPEILASTGVTISAMDATGVSPVCRVVAEGWWGSVATAELLASVTSGGGYALVVPACGPITYTLKPSNYLFTWSPPTRTVTVGAGGSSAGGRSSSTGSASGGSSISAGNMEQMDATGGGGQMQQQMQQQQQNSGGSGNSGKRGEQMIYYQSGKK